MSDLKKVDTLGDALSTIFGVQWPYGGQVMALRTLANEFSLRVRADGTWHVSLPHVSLKQGALLSTPTQKGETPHEAIAQAWHTFAAPDAVVVVDIPGKPRRSLRWRVCMWVDLDGAAQSEHPTTEVPA